MQNIIAKIHLQNIQHNARVFRDRTGKPVCAVVKADAYGHGAIEVVNALESVVDLFAVALLSEAQAIQTAACEKSVLVFTPPMTEEEVLFGAERGLIFSVTDYGVALLLSRTAQKHRLLVRVHLKVNTGMNRYGRSLQTLGKACKVLQENPFVQVEGLYSHLYGNTLAIAEEQRALFVRAICVCRRYFPNVCCHLSATFGALLGEEFTFDMTRIGLGLYGYLPVANGLPALPLKKGMTVYAPVTATRKYVFGGAGYGERLQTLPKDGRLYTLRVGYADGILRKQDKDVCGGVCMDAWIREGKERKAKLLPVMTDAEEMAKVCDTIAYEVLCAITRRAMRVYEE